MAEALRIGADFNAMTSSLKPGSPGRFHPRLDFDDDVTSTAPHLEHRCRIYRTQNEPTGFDDITRRLVMAQQTGRHLLDDVRLGIATHRSKHRPEGSVGPSDERGRQRVRRSLTGAVLRRVSWIQREPDPAVVQEDAGGSCDQVTAETPRIGLDQRDRHPGRVGHGQVDRATVAEGPRPIRHRIRRDRRTSFIEASSIDEVSAAGVFVQFGDSVMSCGSGGLDHQVCPQWVSRVVWELESRNDARASQSQVPLGIRGHRPQFVTPHLDAEGRHPFGLVVGEIVFAEFTLTEIH